MLSTLTRCLALALPLVIASRAAAGPETVYFRSADGATELVGYLFKPARPGPHGAVVMLHGRAGPYSANVNADCTQVTRSVASVCNAGTLSKRHAMWGAYWAARGYLALLPDSFGPRGKAHGFGRFTHDDPDRDSVNEVTVRPHGFRGALAFYPGCGRRALSDLVIATSAPIAMYLGSDDEEVSPTICQHVADRSRAAGTRIDLMLYQGATHDFDDPGEKRQSVPQNAAAKDDAMKRALATVEGMRE